MLKYQLIITPVFIHSIFRFVMGGNVKSFTILYGKFKDKFGADDIVSSWIVTLHGCFKMMTGSTCS